MRGGESSLKSINYIRMCQSFLRLSVVVAILLAICNVAYSQSSIDRFIQDYDLSGFSAAVDESIVESAIQDILPDIPNAYQASFTVVDGGSYYLNEYTEQSPASFFDARFENLTGENQDVLYLGRVVTVEGRNNIYTRINLKMIEDYPCLTEESITSMEEQLNSVLEGEEGVSPTELEVAVIKRFKELLNRFTECCVPYGEVGAKSDETCELCTFDSSSLSPSSEFANMVLQNGRNDEESKGRFVELKAIESEFLGSHFEDASLSSTRLPVLKTKFKDNVLRSVGFQAPYPDMDVDILRDLAAINNTALPGSVNITVAYFDEANCNSLSTYLATTSLARSGLVVDCPYDYDEELIILRIGEEVRIFSRIRSGLPEFDPDVIATNGSKVIIPALIAREILKRAAMGAVNVLIDITFSVIIEKTFGGDPECDGQGPPHSWADAWRDYRTNEFKNKYVAVWKIMVTFAEGAINVPPFYSAVAAGLTDGFKYLFTGIPPPGVDLEEEESCNDGGFKFAKLAGFDLKTFFKVIVKSTVQDFLFGRALDGVIKWARKAKTVISRTPVFIGDAFVGDFKGLLIWHAFKNPKLVRAWSDLFARNVPSSLRRNTKFLSRLSDNPNLANYIDNLTPEGRIDLADNVDLWLKRYDARASLKNRNYDEAISVLEGTPGIPEVYNGAKYIGKLNTPDSPDAITATPASLQNIVNSTVDISSISSKLGLSQDVVQAAKQHLFVTEHLIETTQGVFTQGRFATYHHITQWWKSAANGTISSRDATSLRKLIGHEYIESALMQRGMVYRQLDVPSGGKYGAHELSVGEDSGDFSHWASANGLYRNLPSFDLNSDLSNIDDVVGWIKTIEGL